MFNPIICFSRHRMKQFFRSQINSSDTADELRKKAKSIFQSKDKQLHYRSFLTTPKQFSFSHNQLSLLKVRCAQALSSMFIKISRSPGQSLFSLKQQLQHKCSNSCHTANKLSPNKNMKMTVLYLGYHCAIKSDQTKKM